jgi:hypothetical protein
MIDTFVQERTQLSASHIDFRVSMRSTGVWKQDAKLGAIVEVAANFLALYKDVILSDPLLKFKLLSEFEVVWRELIDHYFDKRRISFWEFVNGGHLCQNLLDPEPYAMLSSIRRQVIQKRQHDQMVASSAGMGDSMTEGDTGRQ